MLVEFLKLVITIYTKYLFFGVFHVKARLSVPVNQHFSDADY